MTQNPTPSIVAPPLPSPASPRGRRRWLTVLLAFLIFIAGAMVGTGLTIAVAIHRIRHAIQHPEEAPHRITNRLRRELSLTDQQAFEVETIVTRRLGELQALRREMNPRIERIIDQAISEIGAVLTPEQSVRWQRRIAEYRADWMPPPPPPGAGAPPGPPGPPPPPPPPDDQPPSDSR